MPPMLPYQPGGSSFGIADVVGNLGDGLNVVVFGNDGVLRVRAVVASDAENAFTLTILAHAIARCAHDAGKILAEDERQRAVPSIAYLPIHRVDPRNRDADKNFIRRVVGLRKL